MTVDKSILAAGLAAGLIAVGVLAVLGPGTLPEGAAGEPLMLRLTAFEAEAPGSHLPGSSHSKPDGEVELSWNGSVAQVPGPSGSTLDALAVDTRLPEGGGVTYFLADRRIEILNGREVDRMDGEPLFGFPTTTSWFLGPRAWAPFMLFPLAGQSLPAGDPVPYTFLGYDLTATAEGPNAVIVRPAGETVLSYRFELRDGSVMPIRIVQTIDDPAVTRHETVWNTSRIEIGPPTGREADQQAESPWAEQVGAPRAPYDRWPPSGEDPPHPFPIAQAIALARQASPVEQDDDAATVDAYFEEHPGACLMDATFEEFRATGAGPSRTAEEDRWTLRFAAPDHDYLNFTVHRYAATDGTGGESVLSDVSGLEQGTGVQPSSCWSETPEEAPDMMTLGAIYAECVETIGHDLEMGVATDLEEHLLRIGGKIQPGTAISGCSSSGEWFTRDLFLGHLTGISASLVEDGSIPLPTPG